MRRCREGMRTRRAGLTCVCHPQVKTLSVAQLLALAVFELVCWVVRTSQGLRRHLSCVKVFCEGSWCARRVKHPAFTSGASSGSHYHHRRPCPLLPQTVQTGATETTRSPPLYSTPHPLPLHSTFILFFLLGILSGSRLKRAFSKWSPGGLHPPRILVILY